MLVRSKNSATSTNRVETGNGEERDREQSAHDGDRGLFVSICVLVELCMEGRVKSGLEMMAYVNST